MSRHITTRSDALLISALLKQIKELRAEVRDALRVIATMRSPAGDGSSLDVDKPQE